MIIPIVSDSVLISDTESKEPMPEFPLVVSNYPDSKGVGIIDQTGQHIYFSYEMGKEIAKTILDYSKPKKKSK